MKNLCFGFFLALCLTILCFQKSALCSEELPSPSPSPPQLIKTVRVGIYLNFPFVYENKGLPTGFHAELLKKVAEQEGWKLEYQFLGSLKNVIDGLEDGSLDLSMGLVKTDDRQKLLTFSTEKTAAQRNQIFIQSDRQDIRQIADLDGKTVGYINQDSIGDNFREVCSKLGIQPITRHINSYEQLTSAVITGVVDAGIFSAFQGKKAAQNYDLRATPITFKKTEVFFAASKTADGQLISTIDQHLKAWKKINDSPFHTLENKFLTNSLSQSPKWTSREILITVFSCLLLIFLAILLGNFMARETTTNSLSKSSIRNLLLFILGITTTFWILDSFVEWFFFNSEQQLGLLELFLTDIPPENLYIRGMFFGISCFFGIFVAKYMSKYEESLNFLMRSVDQFEELMDNAPDMIYRMALPSGRYDFVSKASIDISGYSPDQFYKRPRLMEEIIHPDWKNYFNNQWNKLLEGEMEPFYEYQIITKSRETRLINQRNRPCTNKSGELTAIEAIVTDITEFKAPVTAETKDHIIS
nr:transporter substrate-binding domain-containing protein [Desulfobulbaceae bacterium]